MRQIRLTSDRFTIYYGAITSSPEGFKGLQAVKNGLAVVVALEAFGKEESPGNWVFNTPEVGESTLELTEEQYNTLKASMESTQWTGRALRIVGDAFEALTEAK